jgi:hypothetical protein
VRGLESESAVRTNGHSAVARLRELSVKNFIRISARV